MKFLSLAGPFLLAKAVYGQNLAIETDPNAEYIVTNKKNIEEKLKIDPNRQPWFDSNFEEGHPCRWPLNIDCGTVYYRVRNELTKYTSATAWVKVDKIGETAIETASNEGGITISKSRSVSTTITEGWSIGLNIGLNQYSGSGGSISYEKSKSLSNSNTVTMDVVTNTKCPPYHSCHLEIWSWHVTFKGECDNFPKANCGGDVPNFCESTCYDSNYQTRWCGKKVSSSWGETSLREVQSNPCEVTAPVFEGDALKAEVKVIENPLRPDVVSWESHDIAELNIGQKWSPSTKQFYTKERGWFGRPNVPEPRISKEMAAARPAKE